MGLNRWLSRWLCVAAGVDVVAWVESVESMWRLGILTWVLMVVRQLLACVLNQL